MIWVIAVLLAAAAFVLFWPITYKIEAKPWTFKAEIRGWGGLFKKRFVLPDEDPPDGNDDPPHEKEDSFPDEDRRYTESREDSSDEPVKEVSKDRDGTSKATGKAENENESQKEINKDAALPEKPILSYSLSSQEKESYETIKSSAESPDFEGGHDTIEESSSDDPGAWDLIRLAIHNGAVETVLHNLRRLIRLSAHYWTIEGDWGSGDPAETGIAAGLVHAALPYSFVRIRYCYTERICSIQIHAKGRVMPCIAAWIAVRVLLSRPIREIWHAMQGRHGA